MIKSGIFLLLFAIGAASGRGLAATDCPDLQSASSDVSLSYLAGVMPDKDNSECVTLAIRLLASARYEPAVPVLVRLLDFRRPPNEAEKAGIALHPPTIDEFYPAAEALEEIGKSALPAVLDLINSASTSVTARENAVFVWMEIHKYKTPNGVALLRQEAIGTNDPIAKRNLDWAVSRATTWCYGQDRARCKAAATALNLSQ